MDNDKKVLELAEEIAFNLQSENAALKVERDKLEQQVALYKADADRIWTNMPEFWNADSYYEIHEAVSEVVKQRDKLAGQVAMLHEALKAVSGAQKRTTDKPPELVSDWELQLDILRKTGSQVREALSATAETAEKLKG